MGGVETVASRSRDGENDRVEPLKQPFGNGQLTPVLSCQMQPQQASHAFLSDLRPILKISRSRVGIRPHIHQVSDRCPWGYDG